MGAPAAASTTAAAAVAAFPLHCLPIGGCRAANLRCLWVARSKGCYRCCSCSAGDTSAAAAVGCSAAIGPVGQRSDCYGCDFRVRKLLVVELSSQLTVCLLKISIESINFVWEQRFVILKMAGDRSLNGQATFCSIVCDNKCDRTLFRSALFFEAP